MCGIAGIIGSDNNQKVLKELLQPIEYRGEISYLYEMENIPGYGALGIHRLAIVDEGHGKQPIINFDEKLYCVFNGEIYNHEEIREILRDHYPIATQCDSEVVLLAYLKWGDDFVRYLDGMFAVAIFDVNKNKLILTRDPMGIKPLYYSNSDGSVLFSSEIKSLSKQKKVRKIHEIEPGTVWINGKVNNYFSLQKFSKLQQNDFSVHTSNLKECLVSTIDKHIPKDSSRIACLLSGGIDSSIITYLANKAHPCVVAYTLSAPNTASK